MDKGIQEPVGGFPRLGYHREMPGQLHEPRLVAKLTDLIPAQLAGKGCELLQIDDAVRPRDPFVLYDPHGAILAEWEQAPSLGDLLGFVKGA